jgi:hypothetical protein
MNKPNIPVAIARASLIVLSAVFLLIVSILSDYNSIGTLLMGCCVVALAIVVTWNTKRAGIRALLMVMTLAAMFLLGSLFIRAGAYQNQVNRITARAMLGSVGGALESYFVTGSRLPDCKWTCMADAIENAGFWDGLTLTYEGTDQSATHTNIPMKDGWGCRYLFENLGSGSFVLKSSGRDRRFGTEDDLLYVSGTTQEAPDLTLPVWPKKKSK